MIIAILATLLAMFAPANSDGAPEIVMVHVVTEVTEWNEYYREAEAEYADEFDTLFNALTVTSKRTDKGLRVTVKRSNGKLARSYTVKAA